MDEYKARITKVIEKFSERELPKHSKKREHPEKLVEADCRAWFKDADFSMTVVDSSDYGSWSDSKVSEKGFPDSVGDINGLAVFVEFKAKGKLSTISYRQHAFLTHKIERGCFAVCVDSASLLNNHWVMYNSVVDKKKYLIEALPFGALVKKEQEERDEMNRPLFDIE